MMSTTAKSLASLCDMSDVELMENIRRAIGARKNANFLYRKGTVPIMLVAHLDTVHKYGKKKYYIQGENMFAEDGIGGDDRCGVYIILEALKHVKAHVLFTMGEERGGIGAIDFANSGIKPDINMIVEFDRRGVNEAVFYGCGNESFKDRVVKETRFNVGVGSYTDICEICGELDIAGVNLSAGFFNEHTVDEYVNLAYLKKAWEVVPKLARIANERRWTQDEYVMMSGKCNMCYMQDVCMMCDSNFVGNCWFFITENEYIEVESRRYTHGLKGIQEECEGGYRDIYI